MNLPDLQRDPAAFRAALLIDTDGGPRPFSEIVDPWQAADFAALDSGWKRAVVGRSAKAQYQRAWLERPRGHSKSLDLGIAAAWALFASRRRLSGIGAAGDQDQARLLRDAVGRLVYVNPWLGKVLEVQNYRVINTHTESALEIIASDAPTSYGLTPDFVIADEVTHWKKRDLWDALLSSAPKRSTCMFVVIANAGLMDDWQWQTREAVRQDPKWYFSRLEGPVASWITPDLLEEQERLLPGVAYRRLWLNEWTTGGGDALTAEDIAYAFRDDLRPMQAAEAGWDFVAGLDLGVSRDASALVVLGVRREHTGHGRIRLAAHQVWHPRKKQKVNLTDVQLAIVEADRRFDFKQLNYDPWEARHMASQLQAASLGRMVRGSDRRTALPMVEVSPTGTNLQAIATAVIEAFNDHRVELYPDAELKRDLTRLRVEERSFGFRLTSPRDENGHGDLGTAFCLALLAATELASKRKATVTVWSGGSGKKKSAWARAQEQAAYELERMQREYERASGNDDRDAEAAAVAAALGRSIAGLTGSLTAEQMWGIRDRFR